MGLNGESKLAELSGNYGAYGLAAKQKTQYYPTQDAQQTGFIDPANYDLVGGDDLFAIPQPDPENGMNPNQSLARPGYFAHSTPVPPQGDLNQHKDMALDGNPAENPVNMSGMPTDPQFDLGEIETALMQVLDFNTANACSLAEPFCRRWWLYQVMSQARPPYDDPNDPLIKLGYYVPKLAKICESLLAIIMNTLIPDPSKYDFFQLTAQELWVGLDNLSEALTEQLQQKFRIMRPEVNGGFLGMFNLLMRDMVHTGNMVSMVTHEMLGDFTQAMTPDEIMMGPTVQKIDLFSAKPWRTDVDNSANTPWSFYDPMTPDQAHMFDFENAQEMFEREQPEDTPNRYLEWASASFYNFDLMNQWSMQQIKQYKRWFYVGPFPYYLLRTQMGNNDESKIDFQNDFTYLMMTLAEKYQFDPAKARPDTWFEIHWVGHTIIRCRPYGIDLPAGMGPVCHHKLYPVSGQFWGEGIYDREQWNERTWNDLQRALLHVVKFSAKGCYAANYDMIKASWLQLHGNQLRFQPNDVIELDTQPGDTREFVKKVETNEAAIPLIGDQQTRLLGDMTSDTGIYEDLQGQSRSRTATQAQLNNQNGMTLVDWLIKLIEHGPLRELVSRCYVVMQQAQTDLNIPTTVMVSAEQQALQAVTMQPQDILSLNFIDITMTGRTSPANKQNMFDGFMQIWTAFGPTGAPDIQESFKMACQLRGIPFDQIAFKPDMPKIQQMISNLQTMAGPDWLHWLNPMLQQAMGATLGAGPPNVGMGMQPGGPPSGGFPPPNPHGTPAASGAGRNLPAPHGGPQNQQPPPGPPGMGQPGGALGNSMMQRGA